MPPNILVFHDTPSIEPEIYDGGAGTYSDLIGTKYAHPHDDLVQYLLLAMNADCCVD